MWWWVQKIHSSWRIATACGCFVLGVWVASFVQIPWIWGGVFAAITLGTIIIGFWWVIPIIVCGSIGVGISYGSAHVVSRSVYTQYIGGTFELTGRVKEDISKSSSGGASIQLDAVTIRGSPLPGTVLVSTRTTGAALRGDYVTFFGTMRPAFGSFPATFTASAVKKVARPVPGDTGRVVRDWFAEMVRKQLPDPQASLGIGFLTGQKSTLPEDVAESFKIAGLTHIVIASGYNLTILVQLARRLFSNVSKFLSAALSAAMILLFIAITGMSPSMTRAGLVSGGTLLAWYYGRAFHPLVLLPVVAAITVAFQPSYVWGDLGWQLSFVAFFGVMIVAPLLQAYFFGEKEAGLARQLVGETVAAHAVTLPVIGLSFGTVSHVAIVANVLVVPLVPLAMLLTFINGLLAIAGFAFGEILAVPTTWLLEYMLTVARFVSELSWAQSEVPWPSWVWAVYSMLLVSACWWMWRTTKYSFRPVQPLST